jgi:hypothetical protein
MHRLGRKLETPPALTKGSPIGVPVPGKKRNILNTGISISTLSLRRTIRPPISCQSQIAMAVIEWHRGWLGNSAGGESELPAALCSPYPVRRKSKGPARQLMLKALLSAAVSDVAAASFLRLSAVGTGGATNERAGAMASRRENKGLRALLLISLRAWSADSSAFATS